jgi:hypothetical protein
VIGKVLRGERVDGLLRYLFGPGRANEHTAPHLVASWDGAPAKLEPGLLPDGRRDVGPLSALLEAGTDPAIISEWISEVTAARTRFKIDLDRINGQPRLTKAQIAAIVDQLAGLATVLQNADPRDRAEVYRQMRLKLTYHNKRRLIVAETQSDESCRYLGVRGGT